MTAKCGRCGTKTSASQAEKNIAILGDNLHAMTALGSDQALLKHAKNLKIIYIDPPYNVGGNFGYKNLWRGVADQKFQWAAEHGAFLEFLEPRLQLSKRLLSDDGVIFVSICDQEYSHLKILMDQVFGSANCLGTIVWDKAQGANGKHLTTIHEYVLVYAKNYKMAPKLAVAKPSAQMMVKKSKELHDSGVPYSKAQDVYRKWVADGERSGLISTGVSPYKNLHPDTFRPFRATSSCAHDNPTRRSHRKIKHPVTGKDCKAPAKGWKWCEKTLDEMQKHEKFVRGTNFVVAGQFVFGKDESAVPRKLQYLDEKMTQGFPSVLSVAYGGQKDLPAEIDFSTPKPVKLMKELIRAYPDKKCAVMDFFAGSGSTIQAVEELNSEDNGDRSWIAIECMESTFNKVLVPRLKKIAKNDFQTAEVICNSGDLASAMKRG